MKKDFRRWIERRCNIKLRYDVVIHNEYCQPEDEAKKMHLLKYTTRATWRDAKNLDVINVIKGFRTTSSWGKWPETVEQPKSVKIDSGHCPACGDSLQFEKLKAPREFFADGNMLSAEIEAGFYFVIELSEEPRGSP